MSFRLGYLPLAKYYQYNFNMPLCHLEIYCFEFTDHILVFFLKRKRKTLHVKLKGAVRLNTYPGNSSTMFGFEP